jgi:hypothetical protein
VSADDKPGRVRVVDRRRFTADGDPRDVATEAQPAAAGAQPNPEPPATPAAASPEPPAADPGRTAGTPPREPEEAAWPSSNVGFADLVDLLATQAYAQLTGQGTARGRDLQSARVFIDFLGVLQDKTKGRLNAQEEKLLDDVLYQLRTLCIAPSR